MAFGSIFGFWVNSLLLGRIFVDFSPLVRFLACGMIFEFLEDIWLFGRFLSFSFIFRFWVNIGFWVYSLLLGRFFVEFWPLVRFLAFGTIFGFLDDFWRFLSFEMIFGFWVNIWLLG